MRCLAGERRWRSHEQDRTGPVQGVQGAASVVEPLCDRRASSPAAPHRTAAVSPRYRLGVARSWHRVLHGPRTGGDPRCPV